MTESLGSLVDILRNTIEIVQEETLREKLGVTLESVDLELSVEATSETGVDVSVKYGASLGAGMTRSSGSTNRMKLTLTPTKPLHLGAKQPVASDRLATAIVTIARDASAVKARTKGAFKVQEFEVALDIAQSKDGGLHLVFVRGESGGSHHTLTLHFRPE